MSDRTTDTTGPSGPGGHDTAEGVRKVAELVDAARICMLTTMTADGRHVSRPMALQDVEFDGDLWFFAYADSDKAHQVQANPQVNVAFSDDKHQAWTSVSGTASLVTDRAKMEELWAAPLEVWFPDGLDTDGITLVKVHAETAEWWEASGSRAKRLVGAVRAAVTGDPDKFPSENHTERLS
ncbi:pyridoxamine 5'-phosphate oxidase family protein [Nocardioides litoris]|uniref:pyridoxamine 5'-phosphate oxidase family protein n=1 Tax=Nocardioides litoris TaxID=1926648 RepID=UPI001123D939|nr:pyridoxamine 5'-phosphate oxidase family protein [Nocardioides litoris]